MTTAVWKRRACDVIAISVLASFCALARAGWTPIDYTDTWWNPAESGWGLQLVQQVDAMFATVYAYDPQANPDWYTAALSPVSDGVWKGDLYASRGPWLGSPFDPGLVTRRRVGDITITFASTSVGTLSYSVDGVPVRKSIERMTMRNDNVSGGYLMWLNASTRCGSGTETGALAAVADVRHAGSAMTSDIEFVAADGSFGCTFSGSFVQTGRRARSDGTYTCPTGASGTYSITDLELAGDHMCGDISMRNVANGCTLTATFSSTRF